MIELIPDAAAVDNLCNFKFLNRDEVISNFKSEFYRCGANVTMKHYHIELVHVRLDSTFVPAFITNCGESLLVKFPI